MRKIISGFLGQVSDGERVYTYLLTTSAYHDPALASLIEYGTALPVIPDNSGLSITEQVWFQPQGGSSGVSISNVPLINAENDFSDWGRYTVAGLPWTFGRGYADQPWSEWWKAYFEGRGKPEFMGQERVIIALRDTFGYMRQPVASQIFSEDDTTNEKLIAATVPMVFGSAYQVDPLLTEPQILRYAVGSNVNDVPRVQEGGNPATPIFEYVPLGFQLYASPTLKITCDVSGPPVEGWVDQDVLLGIGDFADWGTGGHPDGWDVTEDSPYSVIAEVQDGARVENTAKIDGDTGWITGGDYVSEVNPGTGDAWVPVGEATLAEAVEADDGSYALLATGDTFITRLTGTDWTFGLTPDVQPVGVEVRTVWENTAGDGNATRSMFYLRYPDGSNRGLQSSPTGFPGAKSTDTVGGNTTLPPGLTKEVLEHPDFALVTTGRRVSVGFTGCRIHQLAIRVHYGTVVDRLRLTTQDAVMTTGNRYLLRIYTLGSTGDSIRGYWGGVNDHASPIPTSDSPYAQISAQLEGEAVHEFSFIASGPRFAIEFDRGDGNGEQTINRLELIDQSASRERYHDLIRYIHETADKDPDEACENAALALVQTQAGNPRLGWYVSDQTTREQLATLFSHSLAAASWGSITGLWTAAQMRIPQQPDGAYLSIDGAYGAGHARADTGNDLRDRVHAARNVHPLRDSETAGVTTTWPEEQRQLVIDKWRITEKADWSNLVGYPTLTLTSISPSSGDTAGGTNVTLTGTGFSGYGNDSGDDVTFGGTSATNITVVSDTEITCDTPSGTAGTVDVTITIGGESVTLSGGFEYAASGAWTPADITTLLWVEADSASPFNDMSGNDDHFTAVSGYSLPSIESAELNGRDVFRFNGSTQLMESPCGLDIRDAHVFVVARARAADQFISANRDGVTNTRWYISNSDNQVFRWGASFVDADLSAVWRIFESVADGDNKEGFYTGASQGTTTDANTHTFTNLRIGGGRPGGSIRTGEVDVYAVVKIPVSTSAADVERLQGYLAHRCGLEGDLPSGHPYKDSPP